MVKQVFLNQEKEWAYYLSKAIHTTFCHTNDYHKLEANQTPFLFVFEEEEGFIAIPFLKRKIENTQYYDLTSVYGYSGPISNKPLNELSTDFFYAFKTSLLCFLKNEKYLSVFLRLNPFSNQVILLEKLGGIYDNGETVYIDLTVSAEERKSKYHKTVHSSIKKCKNNRYEIREENNTKGINQFIELYTKNMLRKKATDYYFFKENYISQLLTSTNFVAKLFIVFDKDIAICAAIIIFYKETIHAHLITTKESYLWASPAKFLIDEICNIGKLHGLKSLHLGGGVGFKDDSLFRWKKGFSDKILHYCSWRYIVDKKLYNQLVLNKGLVFSSNIDFFPLYRYVSA